MNSHDMRFVLLKVQSETEWNSHGNIPTYRDYFWTALWYFPEKQGKGQQWATNPNLNNTSLNTCFWLHTNNKINNKNHDITKKTIMYTYLKTTTLKGYDDIKILQQKQLSNSGHVLLTLSHGRRHLVGRYNNSQSRTIVRSFSGAVIKSPN